MELLIILAACALCFTVAYRAYGGLLARLLRLDPNRPTPAVEMRDDVDYVPIEPKFLMSQHFSAIAAAGPVVGPILAGMSFGWLPALIWIVLGSIFIGGFHDFASLVASVRHRARSIAEIVREYMSTRSFVLFLLFVWIALIYIIVAFTDIVAGSFVGRQTLQDGTVVNGAGIATSSLLYLALPLAMGLLLRFTRLSLGWATAMFLPLVAGAIAVGQFIPFDLGSLLGMSDFHASRVWAVALLVYCFAASLVPMWLLLQPRGHLGGYFLYAALACGVLGIFAGGDSITYPMFIGWTSANGDSLVPMLFILIACGACSGFHCLIASGTTSKQLKRETDAKSIGYGSMLLEGMLAVVSLSYVMTLTLDSARGMQANLVYAQGVARFLSWLGVSGAIAVSFGLLAFTTFVYDTLDVCTRLGRYIVQELTGLRGAAGRWISTALTAGAPVYFLLSTPLDAAGKPQPAWRLFWALFGASNQLLAALALLGITVWLWRTRRARWVWLVAGAPMVFMYAMSAWALMGFVQQGFKPYFTSWSAADLPSSPVPWVATVLLALAGLVLAEGMRVFFKRPIVAAVEEQTVPA